MLTRPVSGLGLALTGSLHRFAPARQFLVVDRVHAQRAAAFAAVLGVRRFGFRRQGRDHGGKLTGDHAGASSEGPPVRRDGLTFAPFPDVDTVPMPQQIHHFVVFGATSFVGQILTRYLYQRHGIGAGRADVEEVDLEPVDHGGELPQRIEPRFAGPPVVAAGRAERPAPWVGRRDREGAHALHPLDHALGLQLAQRAARHQVPRGRAAATQRRGLTGRRSAPETTAARLRVLTDEAAAVLLSAERGTARCSQRNCCFPAVLGARCRIQSGAVIGADGFGYETYANYALDVLELSARAGLPPPKVYVIDQDQPNAFATGRGPRHAVVCATQGLLRSMPRDEIEGVMAHELMHVKHRDILIGSVAAARGGATSVYGIEPWASRFRGLSEPQVDEVSAALLVAADETAFAVEFLPGQFDQRADSAAQCVQILTGKERPLVSSAKVIILKGSVSANELAKIKGFVINAVDSHEASMAVPSTSPSPCTAWPSPQENKAPSLNTGK